MLVIVKEFISATQTHRMYGIVMQLSSLSTTQSRDVQALKFVIMRRAPTDDIVLDVWPELA